MANIQDVLTREAGRIGPQIYRERNPSTPWLAHTYKDVFPKGMGVTINSLTWDRTFNDGLSWSAVGVNDGSGNSCLPTAANIEFAQTLRSYNLEQAAVQSPEFCVNDLYTSFSTKDQLGAIYDTLKQDTVQSWIDRNRSEYIRIAENKVILDEAGTNISEQFLSGSTFPATESTSILTNEVLEHIHTILTQDGAGANASGMTEGVPVYSLFTSRETSRALKKAEGWRDDYRYSKLASTLLNPLGVSTSHNGYAHVIDNQLPRYNWDSDNSQWEAVPFWTTVSTTNGDKAVVNPAYHVATHEDSIVFHKDVYHCLTPEPTTNPGGNQKYDPVNYMGDFQFLNIRDKVENPLGDIGFFYGRFASASKPIKPQWGYVIRHKRCIDLKLADCS